MNHLEQWDYITALRSHRRQIEGGFFEIIIRNSEDRTRKFSRFGCAFAPAFGRAVAASRRRLDAGLKPRSTSEATAKDKYRDPSTRAMRSLRMTSVGSGTFEGSRRLLQDGDSGEVIGYAGFPFGGAGVVDAYAVGVDGYGYGHVFDVELVDGFHAEVFEGEDAAALDGF